VFAGFVSLVLGAGALAVSAKEVFPGESRKWRHYQSPNFELYSGNSDRESRDVLQNLELLHAAFQDFVKLPVRRPLPVTVFYFADDDDFRAYAPTVYGKKHTFAGFYVERPDRAIILMSPRDEQQQAQQLVFHEYVHHLFRVMEERPPTWYNEGMAELFSTLQEESGRLVLGRPIVGRVGQLQREGLMPLEKLFAVSHDSAVFRDGEHTGQFYSQSWALVHFCYLGATDIPREKLTLFLNVARSPRFAEQPERVRAFTRELFGFDYPELQQRVERYMRVGRYQGRTLPLPQIADAKTYASRVVPPEEAQLRLAEVAARVNRTPEARLALLHGAGRHPEDTRIDETLGTLAYFENDQTGARERWERAIEHGTTNPAVFHEVARQMTQRLFAQFDPFYQMPEEMAARLRVLLRRSIEAAPQQTAAYETLAWVEATSAECVVANVNLVQERFPHLKTKDRTLVSLALVRHRRGDNAGALALLDDLPKLDPDEWSERAAERLRAKIEGRPPVREPRAPGEKPPGKMRTPPIRLTPDSLKRGP
jgi:hypothetical protein